MGRGSEKCREIADRYRKGETVATLAREYRISSQRIYQILVQESGREACSRLPVGALSSRTMKALLYNPILPVQIDEIDPEWVVRNFDAFDLKGIRNLGDKGQKEIIAWVEARGLKLRERAVAVAGLKQERNS